MTRAFDAPRLDVAAFAAAGGKLAGEGRLAEFPRLLAEAVEPDPDTRVEWQARGEQRPGPDGKPTPWLHLRAQARVPLTCQRCLAAVQEELAVQRWFRFAQDEDSAAAEDEQAEEDVLALSREFDLRALVEDELLLALPVVPRHDICPQPVPLSAADPAFEQASARPNPFAVLGTLGAGGPKAGKPH